MAARKSRSSAGNVRATKPKTTRPAASSRRMPATQIPAKSAIAGKTFDAAPDRIDLRDWPYQPTLAPLPDLLVNCDRVPKILDQGAEGACTGFALAAVVNFHLAQRNINRLVSPRMLYDMARRYDEWPGEDYEGSSARGAMKGWMAHGVCSERSWKITKKGPRHFSPGIAEEASGTPGGAYYRVIHTNVRDMHAALNEVGILSATLMVHSGWDPNHLTIRQTVEYVDSGSVRKRSFPVIQRKGSARDGHAVAVVGYTRDGFIIQNSWGKGWGDNGFALLPYEDWLLHATDVWAAQLGVPISVSGWSQGLADTTAGIQRATRTVPLADIRPYVVDIGNNGLLSDSGQYWTTPQDIRRLFEESIPNATKNWARKRVMLYLHGGLNDEAAVAKRVVAFRDVCLANEVYPVHIMWESGLMESLQSSIADAFTDSDERAGSARDWMRKFRDHLVEAKDYSFELSVAWAGRKLWGEMKENAKLASQGPAGGMSIVVKEALRALDQLSTSARAKWELHIVGHSAGSIFAAHAIGLLAKLKIDLKTFQLMAPAIRVDLFKQLVVPWITKRLIPKPVMYILSDQGELDDDVGPYGKSLLYLVSNAFEGERETPLLGMQRFLNDDRELNSLFSGGHLVIAGAAALGAEENQATMASVSRSDSHGGFDNDPATMNAVLSRILGGAVPARRFTARDLAY